MKNLIAMFGLVLAFSAAAAAQGNTPFVDDREKNQKERIVDGFQSGALSFKETGKLLKQQAEIRKFERHAKADGNVSFVERVRLHNKLNNASGNIRRKKNN